MEDKLVIKPWPNGTRFIVRNSTLNGEPIIEGEATVVGHNFENNYSVRFNEDKWGGNDFPVDRFLDGGDMIPA